MDIMHLLTVADFCRTARISRSTWHKLKRQGATPAIINVGGVQRIRPKAVEDWFAQNEAEIIPEKNTRV